MTPLWAGSGRNVRIEPREVVWAAVLLLACVLVAGLLVIGVVLVLR